MAEKECIEREAAIENAISQMRVSKSELCMRERLMNLPAADVRPVVLCRDCVHYEMGVCLKIYDDGAANKDAWQERKPTDFCSYGEDRNVPTNRETKICSTNYTKTVTADEEREVLNVRAWLNCGADMMEES